MMLVGHSQCQGIEEYRTTTAAPRALHDTTSVAKMRSRAQSLAAEVGQLVSPGLTVRVRCLESATGCELGVNTQMLRGWARHRKERRRLCNMIPESTSSGLSRWLCLPVLRVARFGFKTEWMTCHPAVHGSSLMCALSRRWPHSYSHHSLLVLLQLACWVWQRVPLPPARRI